MSRTEELPPDDETGGRRTFLMWLLLAGAAVLGAFLFWQNKESVCPKVVPDAPDVGECVVFTPAWAIAGTVLCLVIGAFAVVQLVRGR